MDTEDIISIAQKNRHLFLLERVKSGNISKSQIKELKNLESATDSEFNKNISTAHTQEAVARSLGVSTRTVQYWARDGMPVNSDGTYDILKIQEWRMKKQGHGKKSDLSKKDQADLRFRTAKANLAEMDYKKKMGQLLDKDDVEAGRVERVIVLKKKLLDMPRQLAPQLVGQEIVKIEEILNLRIREAIEEFSQDQNKNQS